MTTSAMAPAPRDRNPYTKPRQSRWLGRAALALLGACLSAVLIGTAFFKPSLADGHLSLAPRFAIGTWTADLPSHLPWVAAFALLTAAIIPLRAIQWRHTLGERAPGFRHRYHSVAIGAFFHNAVPGKLGEFVRAFVLSRRQGLPFFESLGSVLVCKLLELAALIAVVGIALAGPLGAGASSLVPAVLAAFGLFAALLGVALAGARYAGRLSAWLDSRGRLPKLSMALGHLGKGLGATRSPRQAALAFAASFGPVLASAMAYGVALQALGVERGLFAGGIVLGAISLGQLSPGLPIGMGMYYLTSSWAARALGAAPEQAASFAALTHLATFSTQLLVGFVSVLVYRVRLRHLLRAKAEMLKADAPPEPDPALGPTR